VIARSHFTRLADDDGVDAKTVERDYVLTQVLASIAEQPESRQMAFKGGTALRLCYFPEYRYSADLDFSLTGEMPVDEALAVVRTALTQVVERVELTHLAVTADGRRIEYIGPLGGKGRDVKLDLAQDELVEETTMKPLIVRYPDQTPADINVSTLDEIAAEKLRCVIQRLLARDLFDLDELFVRHEVDAEGAWPAFERKARHKGIDPERFVDAFEKRMPQWKARWEREMEEHVVGELPEFKRIERGVRRALRSRLRSE
jgi:predicted nucleotidyltransferase component of viral defense system